MREMFIDMRACDPSRIARANAISIDFLTGVGEQHSAVFCLAAWRPPPNFAMLPGLGEERMAS
jgi:hypothetical protein